MTFKWCENSPEVKRWSSEEIIISYVCKTDNNFHRYHTDLFIEWTNGNPCTIVEIKPKKQRSAPKKQGKTKRAYMTEALTFVKNQSKWEAAARYAEKRGWLFQVWDENELKRRGIKIL